MKLRIERREDAKEGEPLTSHDLRIFLGEMELTANGNFVCGLDLRLRPDELVTASIEIAPTSIVFSGDVLAEFTALARRSEEDDESEEAAE